MVVGRGERDDRAHAQGGQAAAVGGLVLGRVAERADTDDAPWPGMSRGTDCTVPSVPGLVRVTVAPAKSSAVTFWCGPCAPGPRRPCTKARKSRLSASRITGTSRVRVPSLLLDVDGQTEADVVVTDHPGRALLVDLGRRRTR